MTNKKTATKPIVKKKTHEKQNGRENISVKRTKQKEILFWVRFTNASDSENN